MQRCHDHGLDVELSLARSVVRTVCTVPGARTQPAEARAFVEATGVDALAVAVGTSHAMTERHAALDLELISELQAIVPVPLVLRLLGVPDEELVERSTPA